MKTPKGPSRAKPFKVRDHVQWKWWGGMIYGEVKEVHLSPIVKDLKGKKIKRNGSPENPAYLVQSEAGNLALKLHSELTASDLLFRRGR